MFNSANAWVTNALGAKPKSISILSISLTQLSHPWGMLSEHMKHDLTKRLGMNYSNIDSHAEATIKHYYHKTIALPFSRSEIKVVATEISLKFNQLRDTGQQHKIPRFISEISTLLGTPQEPSNPDQVFLSKYWRRVIEKYADKQRENLAFRLGLIRNGCSSYSAQQRLTEDTTANKAFISQLLKKGDKASFNKAQAITNKEEYNQSLITAKIAGLTTISQKPNSSGIMITITSPYSHTNIEDGINYFKGLQGKLNSFRAKKGLCLAGLSSIEPFQSGLPHMHIYIIGNNVDLHLYIKKIQEIISYQYHNNSIYVIWEDLKISSLGRYVAKHTLYPEPHIAAWYKAHSCRRLNFFGVPSDEAWNSLRRVTFLPKKSKRLKEAQRAAKSGDYASFLELMGGIDAKRSKRPYQFIYHPRSKKRVGIIIFGISLYKKCFYYKLIDIVTTKFPRWINTLQSIHKYCGATGLRSPPRPIQPTQDIEERKNQLHNKLR